MKCIFYCLLGLLISLVNYSYSADRFTTLIADTVINPTKSQISKELVQLRDSIDMTILNVQKKLSANKDENSQLLNKAYKELNLQRAQIEKAIEEVVVSSANTWDDNTTRNALAQTAEKRRMYYQIVNQIMELSSSQAYK